MILKATGFRTSFLMPGPHTLARIDSLWYGNSKGDIKSRGDIEYRVASDLRDTGVLRIGEPSQHPSFWRPVSLDAQSLRENYSPGAFSDIFSYVDLPDFVDGNVFERFTAALVEGNEHFTPKYGTLQPLAIKAMSALTGRISRLDPDKFNSCVVRLRNAEIKLDLNGVTFSLAPEVLSVPSFAGRWLLGRTATYEEVPSLENVFLGLMNKGFDLTNVSFLGSNVELITKPAEQFN